MDNIKNLISKTKIKLGIYHIINTIIKIFIVLFLLIFINYFLDLLSLSSHNIRFVLLFLCISALFYLTVKTIKKIIYLKNADEEISLLIQKKNENLKDDLIIAVQLTKNIYPNTSVELTDAFIKHTSSKISTDMLKNVIGPKNLKNIFIIFTVLIINFIIFSSQLTLKRYFLIFTSATEFTVSPKDTTITAGSDVTIFVVPKSED